MRSSFALHVASVTGILLPLSGGCTSSDSLPQTISQGVAAALVEDAPTATAQIAAGDGVEADPNGPETPAAQMPPPTPAPQKFAGYLAAYFSANDETGLYLAMGTEPTQISQQLNHGNPIFQSKLDDRLLRDPHILRDQNNIFHLIATVSNTHPRFQIYDSTDLITWTTGRLVDASVAGVQGSSCWAPELLYDPDKKVYMAYWTSTPNNNWNNTSIYYSTTTDFTSWSPAKVLLKDPGGAVMDADIKAWKGRFTMVYRFNSQVWQRTADAAQGPYNAPTLAYDLNVEGPFIYPTIDGDRLIMVFDYYGGNQGKWGAAELTGQDQWQLISQGNWPYYNKAAYFPAGIRHGSVMPITQAEMDALAAALRTTPVAAP